MKSFSLALTFTSAFLVVTIIAIEVVAQSPSGAKAVSSSASLRPTTEPTVPGMQYDAGDPTTDEQLVLEFINRARKDPIAEGLRLKIDIKEGLTPEQQALVGPRPPLAMNKILLSTARAHSSEMNAKNYFAHNDPEGKSPGDRITAAEYDWTSWGENIAASTKATAVELEEMLIVDKGDAGRGHRVNLLDIHAGPPFGEIGVGLFLGSTPNSMDLGSFLTQDFGTSEAGPFVLGICYHDRNANGFYDLGEGLSGVTIRPDRGEYFAVTSTSGGYAFPGSKIGGTVVITATGGRLSGSLTGNATMIGANVKVDFVVPASQVKPGK